MLLERNAFDSIAFCSQCMNKISISFQLKLPESEKSQKASVAHLAAKAFSNGMEAAVIGWHEVKIHDYTALRKKC